MSASFGDSHDLESPGKDIIPAFIMKVDDHPLKAQLTYG